MTGCSDRKTRPSTKPGSTISFGGFRSVDVDGGNYEVIYGLLDYGNCVITDNLWEKIRGEENDSYFNRMVIAEIKDTLETVKTSCDPFPENIRNKLAYFAMYMWAPASSPLRKEASKAGIEWHSLVTTLRKTRLTRDIDEYIKSESEYWAGSDQTEDSPDPLEDVDPMVVKS